MATTYESNVILGNGKKYDVIGTRPIRHDGADKVTGRAAYGADIHPTGLLHAKVLRSPHAHAKIKRIDVNKAEAHPSVIAVVTADDIGPPVTADTTVDTGLGSVSLKYLRDNVLARGKVLYKGHPVAAVAATNPHEAEEALSLIEVEYEVLPSVMKAPEGMEQDAPILHNDLVTSGLGGNHDDEKDTNIATRVLWELGDLEEGFGEADVVIEREFDTATVHQGYIEPQNVTALWNNDGRITVWCSTQGSFTTRGAVAAVLGKPVSDVKVVPMEIGGGFGGKIPVYVEPVAALLSKKSGNRPVKNVMTREEVFEATGPTPGSFIRIKIGATKDGKITAAQAHLAYEAGAFSGGMIEAGCKCVFAPYDIANVHVDGYDVLVNKPKTAAYRAPGSTNAAFGTESVISELADELGFDGIDFRLMNSAKEGSRRADGVVNDKIGCVEVLEAMKNHPHYSAPLESPNTARGIAVGYWFNAGLESSAAIAVNPDGSVSLIEGSTDIGGSRTSLAMQAAEALGIAAEDVNPTVVDTDSIGYTSVTGGSRVTFATGWATYLAAQDVKSQMIKRAATIWDVKPDSLDMEKGVITSRDDSSLKITFKSLAADLNGTGGPIIGRGTIDPKVVAGSFAGNIVDVRVDPETGKVDVLRFTVVQDAGKAIHPSYVEGQMQGGTTQGIGWALNEEYFMTPDGKMANSTLLDYRMPVSLDLPRIDTVIVEVPNPSHPFGVRGVGEANIAPPPAALAEAIFKATGVRMRSLPMSPPSIMRAIWDEE